VLSRGIVGSHEDAPTVASPLFKQAFDLRTGRCLTEPEVSVLVYDVRRAGDRVEIRVRGT
jgi:nitrite reductase (NADH) small subunit